MPRSSKLRIAVLMHEALVPPESIEGLDDEQIDQFKMEYDVTTALHNLGHDVIHVPVADELKPIRAALEEHRPHVAFNLLMHFHDAGIYDSAVVAWLELRQLRGKFPCALQLHGSPQSFHESMATHPRR